MGKNFNITLEREFAPSIRPIDMVPQDLTRVFLNLFGNGFYAANKRRLSGTEPGFRPTIRVSTRDLGEAVEVKCATVASAFLRTLAQSSFSRSSRRKQTGEGTGLGLSISYDIVTQQHSGTIDIESEVGVFTQFTICLPRHRRVAPSESKE